MNFEECQDLHAKPCFISPITKNYAPAVTKTIDENYN